MPKQELQNILDVLAASHRGHIPVRALLIAVSQCCSDVAKDFKANNLHSDAHRPYTDAAAALLLCASKVEV